MHFYYRSNSRRLLLAERLQAKTKAAIMATTITLPTRPVSKMRILAPWPFDFKVAYQA